MDRVGSARVSRPGAGKLPRAAWTGLYTALAAAPLLLLLTGAALPSRGFAVELAAGLGYVVLAMLAAQLALGTRPRVVANAIGLDALLLFHRAAGLWAAAFLAGHVVLLAAGEPRFVRYLLDPRAGGPRAVLLWLAIVGIALLVLVPRQVTRLRIPYEAWRVAHALVAAGVVGIALWHVLTAGRSSATAGEQAAVTAFVVAGAAALLFARVVRPALALRRPWRVVEVREERPSVWTLAFEAIGHGGLSFRPGQSVWLTLGRSPFSPRQHPFTVASSAASPRRVELTIKELGDFTREIGRVPVGTRAFLAGPYGAFALDLRAQRPLVAVAGGIGVTPMMSMLRTLRDRGDRRPVLLLYGSGSPDKIVFAAELADLASALDLRVVHVLDQAPPSFPAERGPMGRELLGRHVTGPFADADFFVCGPEPMTNAVERALHDLGVRGDRVHTEHFALVGSRPPGGRSYRERHVRALAAGVALGLFTAAAIVAAVRVEIARPSRLGDAPGLDRAAVRLVLLVGLRGRLGELHPPGQVIGRRVGRVDLERRGPGVDEIVDRSGRDHDQIPRTEGHLHAVDHRDARALDAEQRLLDAHVALLADVAAGRDAHHHGLGPWPREEDAAIGVVGARRLQNVHVIRPLHRALLGRGAGQHG